MEPVEHFIFAVAVSRAVDGVRIFCTTILVASLNNQSANHRAASKNLQEGKRSFSAPQTGNVQTHHQPLHASLQMLHEKVSLSIAPILTV
jgi:hypothetical protein